LQTFNFLSVSSIEETHDLLSNAKRQVKILAGGTDLLVQLREGVQQADLIIDVKKIPELVNVTFDPAEGLQIGAAASCFQICHDDAVLEHYPGLVDAFSLIGGVQIQNRASIGGNLCNASPAADAVPALIVHQAECRVSGPKGERRIPVEQFCTAPGKTALKPDELLVSVYIPPTGRNFGAHYQRFIPRTEMDIAVVGAGAAVTLSEDGNTFQSARLALAAVAPTPLFVPEAGEFLAGKAVSTEAIQQAASIAQSAARPISDLRGTAEQRKQLSAVLARRTLEKAVERARV
jgi:carbon-monoxide dehydrogenase medium subunit